MGSWIHRATTREGGGESRPIAVLTTSYPASPGDVAGSFVRDFCCACARAGHRIEVLCPEVSGPADAGSEPGVSVVRLPYARPRALEFLSKGQGAPEALSRSPWRWGVALAFGARLAASLAHRRRRYRAVVSHWLLPSALAGVLAAPRLPHLAIAHGSDVHLLGRLPMAPTVARLLVARARRIAFVSPSLRTRFRDLLPQASWSQLAEMSVVGPMGVDAARVRGGSARAARLRLGIDPEVPLALFLGRLVPVKGPLLGLEAVARVAGLHLVVAGDGPLRAAMEVRAGRLGLAPRVRFAGVVQGVEKRDLLAAADLLLVPSRRLRDGRGDSLPVAALEALVAGIPVVTTGAAEGLASYPLPQGVCQVAPEDPDGLARALRGALCSGPIPAPLSEEIARGLDWPRVLRRLLAGVVAPGEDS